ncbi:hypothetical protein BD309DRAFT_987902 [Dichomitus squalens]|nr:hypothetical protein BD309DRAFT_987902 [Dichomitus squalens]
MSRSRGPFVLRCGEPSSRYSTRNPKMYGSHASEVLRSASALDLKRSPPPTGKTNTRWSYEHFGAAADTSSIWVIEHIVLGGAVHACPDKVSCLNDCGEVCFFQGTAALPNPPNAFAEEGDIIPSDIVGSRGERRSKPGLSLAAFVSWRTGAIWGASPSSCQAWYTRLSQVSLVAALNALTRLKSPVNLSTEGGNLETPLAGYCLRDDPEDQAIKLCHPSIDSSMPRLPRSHVTLPLAVIEGNLPPFYDSHSIVNDVA